MKYRKKPIEVQAFRLGFDSAPLWCHCEKLSDPDYYFVGLNDGDSIRILAGNWVILEKSRLYVISDDGFRNQYEAVE